jgi:hypothetical protein
MRSARRCTMLVLLCLLCSPAAAWALPGDAPFGPLSPPDGAALPVDPDGIPVTYTCPVYRVADSGFPLFGGPKDYGLSLSTSPAIGGDGRLADAAALNTGSADPSVGPDGCSAALGAGGPPSRIQETPGTYYWQVWRLCTGCTGDYEVGPVRTLTLRSQVAPKLRAPGRAYAGYAFFVTAKAAGAPDGTTAVVQRRSGSRWRSAGTATVLGGQAEAAIVLPRGDQQIRVGLAIGDQQVTSAALRVSVRRARRWSTGPRDAGRYKGRVGSRSVRFNVTGRGRQVRDFRAYVPMLCPGVTAGQFTTQIGTAIVRRTRIAPDGRFVAASTPGRETAIRLRGRLGHRKVSAGRVQLSVGNCSGSASFRASRAG